jgi:organic radical activating enzyme
MTCKNCKEKDTRIHTLEGEIRVVFPQMVAERDKAKERIKELEQERERMLSTETVQKIVRAFWDSQESGDERPSTLLIKVHEILKGE